MITINIRLDDEALLGLQRLADSRRCTVEELLKTLILGLASGTIAPDPVLGVLADESELMNQVLAEAFSARESHPLRQNDGE